MTLLFALPVSAAFICFGEELGGAIYGNPEAGKMLWIMAPLTPILYLDTVADALLKGMDEQVAVMRYSIIDSGLSVLLLYTLLPLFGVKGYITVLFFTSFVNASLSISGSPRSCGFPLTSPAGSGGRCWRPGRPGR